MLTRVGKQKGGVLFRGKSYDLRKKRDVRSPLGTHGGGAGYSGAVQGGAKERDEEVFV